MACIRSWYKCVLVALLGALLLPMAAQEHADAAAVLTLDQAIQLALANNRNLKIVSLSLDNSREQVSIARTQRLPAFNSYVFGSQVLTPLNFIVPAGQFGKYPGIGPIPAQNTPIGNSPAPSAYIVASAVQPLLTLHKVNLQVKAQQLTVEQSAENLRNTRIGLVDQVRQAYYSVLEIQDALRATQASIKQYEELDRITLEFVSQKVALESDSLAVKAKLAEQRYTLLQYSDKLSTGKENLNDLLGRDIMIDFEPQQVTDIAPVEDNLADAQARALAQHPQIKLGEISVKQADMQRRLAKSQYVPDINAAFHYISPFGVNFLPSNVAAIGVEMTWVPFDWGKRRDQVNSAAIALDQSRLNLEETKSQVLLNLDNQFRLLHEAREAVSVAQAQRDASQQKMREVASQYQQQTALLRDALQQQAAVEAANSSYSQALANFWTAKANFQKALGEE